MTNKSKEYAQQVMLDGDKRLQVSVIIEGGGVAYSVEARLYDKDKQRVNNAGVQVSSPTQALEAMQELSRKVIETVERQPGVAEGVSRKIRRKMEECLFKEGVLARDDEGTVLTMTALKNRTNDGMNTRVSNRGMLANMLKGQLRIPPFLGGLPLVDVKTYMEPSAFSIHVFHFLWGDAEDSIETKIEVQSHEIDTITIDVLQRKLDKELNLLRMNHPGDFEVICLDATGQEHLFDEGSSYLAERHLDSEFVWVYDRYGQRGEYSATRFSKVPEKAKMMEPHIPGNHVREDKFAKVAQNFPNSFDDEAPEGLSRILEKMRS